MNVYIMKKKFFQKMIYNFFVKIFLAHIVVVNSPSSCCWSKMEPVLKIFLVTSALKNIQLGIDFMKMYMNANIIKTEYYF